MEIRQLRYFLSTIRHGSVVEAAREHFVTQPAVSLQLKKLERELGETLYERRDRRMVATQAGELLAERAEDILRRVDALASVIQRFRGGETGYLRIGNIDAASIYVLPEVFRRFHASYPDVDMQVRVGDSDTLAGELEAGTIELAIVTLPLPGDNLVVEPFYRDTMVLVAHPSHPLVTDGASRRRPLQAVAERGLIAYPARSTTRRLIDRAFLDAGVTLRAAMEMSSPEAIKRLTEAGLGASVLPSAMVSAEVEKGTLVVVPTGRVRFYRMLGLVHRGPERLSQPAANFRRVLTKTYRLRRGEKRTR